MGSVAGTISRTARAVVVRCGLKEAAGENGDTFQTGSIGLCCPRKKTEKTEKSAYFLENTIILNS
jgi:hypothetical protein